MNDTTNKSSVSGPQVDAGCEPATQRAGEPQKCQAAVKIPDRVVVHLRTVMLFAEAASRFSSDIRVAVGEQTVNGKDVMELLVLLGPGHRELQIVAEGPDAGAALAALQTLVAKSLFEE